MAGAIAFHYLGWLRGVERGLRAILTPIQQKMYSASHSVSNNFRFLKSRSDYLAFAQHYDEMSTELATTTAQLKIAWAENDQLRNLLHFQTAKKINPIVAKVVGKELDSPDQTVILNRGGSDGVKIGEPAVAGDGVLVGKIIKVEPDISIMRLTDDRASRVGATVLNHAASMGVVEGGYGLSLGMSLIPRDDIVVVGDQIVTSGLEPVIPRGLLIGAVAVVENEPYKPFQSAVVAPAVDLSKITIVGVLPTAP